MSVHQWPRAATGPTLLMFLDMGRYVAPCYARTPAASSVQKKPFRETWKGHCKKSLKGSLGKLLKELQGNMKKGIKELTGGHVGNMWNMLEGNFKMGTSWELLGTYTSANTVGGRNACASNSRRKNHQETTGTNGFWRILGFLRAFWGDV